MKAVTLPTKPSELLALAIGDYKKVLTDPNYIVDMDVWHTPVGDLCRVCLAGAVMAKSCKTGLTDVAGPTDYGSEIQRPLRALNDFRVGRIVDGFSYLGLYTNKDMAFARRLQRRCNTRALGDGYISDYPLPPTLGESNPVVFIEYMERLVVSFKEGGVLRWDLNLKNL